MVVSQCIGHFQQPIKQHIRRYKIMLAILKGIVLSTEVKEFDIDGKKIYSPRLILAQEGQTTNLEIKCKQDQLDKFKRFEEIEVEVELIAKARNKETWLEGILQKKINRVQAIGNTTSKDSKSA